MGEMVDYIREQSRRIELKVLGVLFLIILSLLGFVLVADEVTEGDLRTFDQAVLQWTREYIVPGAGTLPAEIVQNITSLGGYPVLVLLLLGVIGYLWLRRLRGDAMFVLVATVGGFGLSHLLKSYFDRQRPEIVEHLVTVHTASFPSGHAMASTITYLTMGTLLAAIQPRKRMKVYIMSVAVFLAFLVGVSRVLLGVHFPTDVMAGWAVGTAWAMTCWIVFRVMLATTDVVEQDLEGGAEA